MIVKSCSFSSDKRLARCEKQYDYRAGERLKPKLKKEGLWRGDWLHQLYEAYYRGQDWEKKHIEIRKAKWDKLFDEEKEMYGEDFPKHIISLMRHYVDHWGPNDSKWKIVSIEQAHELMTVWGFPVRWKSDLIVKEKGLNILVETKNKKEIPDSKERILAPQVHSYCWLLSQVGIKIDRILWNYIRTEPIPMPKLNKDGTISKAKINTDRRHYRQFLKENRIHPKGEEVIGIENILENLPETLALERVYNIPNLKLGEKFVRDWVERHRRARLIKRPLRHFARDCAWMCDYYELCQIDLLGKDRETFIKNNFIQITPADTVEELSTPWKG